MVGRRMCWSKSSDLGKHCNEMYVVIGNKGVHGFLHRAKRGVQFLPTDTVVKFALIDGSE